MQTRELLEKKLHFLKNITGVEASAAVSRDGLLIGSTLKRDADTFGAMSATMFGAAEIASRELGKGVPYRIIIESKKTKVVVAGAGAKALLVVMTKPDASLGQVLVETAKASDEIKEILGENK